MSRKKCDLIKDLNGQLKTGGLSEEKKDHIRTCPECLNEYLVNSWMKGYGGSPSSDISDIPSFDSLWSRSFKEKRVEPDLIERAMFPMKVAGLFARVIIILSIIVIILLNSSAFSGIGKQLDNMNRLGLSFITPFVKMFKSSIFVSIPITIVFAAILLYLVFSIFNSLTRRSYGNI